MINRKGFTLVELMVVLAILGVLAGIGVPSYMNVLNRAKVGADLAKISQFQTNINAFVAELGGVANVYTASGTTAADLLPTKAATAAVELTGAFHGRSIITGQDLTLTDFLDGAAVVTGSPGLTSKTGITATKWGIDKDGNVKVGTGAAGAFTAVEVK